MRILLFFTLCLGSLLSYAKPYVYFNYKVYYTPNGESYVTTSLQFAGGTFQYEADVDGNLVSHVEITQVFSKGEKVIKADKYILDSPLMKDSLVDDFYDVQRYALEEGIYDFELIIKDLISGEEVTGKQEIAIDRLSKNILLSSEIQFIENAYPTEVQSNFNKNGYFVLPYLTNYFPPDYDKIAFYAEFYNTKEILGDSSHFLLIATIEDAETGINLDSYFKHQRLKSADVVPSIFFMSIADLPSGDYNLILRVIDSNNDTLLTSRDFFQRRNDIELSITDINEIEIDLDFRDQLPWDSIPYYLGSLTPISKRYDSESIISLMRSTDTTYMEKYFYSFWKETNPVNPKEAWMEYKAQVHYVEKLFGTQIKRGYEADRGRVHLQYGAPNAEVDRPAEPDAYPYQIWHYYRIGQRSNVRFVFYNPDLVTNDYPLLHSDMQGELQNFRWQGVLHSRSTPNVNVDDPGGVNSYGSQSGTLYNGGM